MDIQGEYRLRVEREQVWAALNDPDVLRQCIPGCEELTQKSDSEFAARVLASIGPVKAKFKTSMALTDLNPPVSYTIVGDSKGGAAGFGKGKATVTLDPDDEGTVLRYSADFKVGGRLAQVGSRLVQGATRKIADDFFGAFSRLLDASAVKVVDEKEQARLQRSKRTRNLVLAAVVVAVLAAVIWLAS